MAEDERDRNPRKPEDPKYLLPSLSNCQSCNRHFPPKSQTLTSLYPLDSQWRIVLLCKDCLRLFKSGAKCSYCFSDLSGCGGGDRLLDCRHCSCRIHIDCVPDKQRFISPAILKPESFICVDCCPLPVFGNKCPRILFTKFPEEELMKEAVSAKEKPLKKARAAKMDAVCVLEVDPVVKDEELALQLHLAMNGSQRILRSSRSMSLDQSLEAKKIKQYNGCTEKVEFCREDKTLLHSWNSFSELRKEPKKENNGCNNSERSVTEVRRSCSDDVVRSSGDHRKPDVWITYQRGNKSNGLGCRGKSPEKNKHMLNGMGVGEICLESQQTSRRSRSHPLDRYAMKYSKRKLILENVMNGEK